MQKYRQLYYKLFNDVTDAIEALKAVQLQAEELYSQYDEDGAKEELPDA